MEVNTIKSRLLSHVPHGFGDRMNSIPVSLSARWLFCRPQWKQVHGDRCVEIVEPGQEAGDCDGLWTRQLGLSVGVATADCVPILMARRDGQAVAAVHAGWRGTFARVAERMVQNLVAAGETPSNWVACIGPSIGPCCYEVSEGLIEDFVDAFPEILKAEIEPTHRKLDLWTINRKQLEKVGLGVVETLRMCTHCSTHEGLPEFESYRRDKSARRQFAVVCCGFEEPKKMSKWANYRRG